MRRPAALLALLALSGTLASSQELAGPVLDRLKAATVFVIARSGPDGATGSGFLFLKRGGSAYVVTCQHVVHGADDISVVFDSGSATERSFKATVIAADPERDLACLRVREAKDLPAPLEIGQKTEVRETENVFVAGFPFGHRLAAGDKNPEISLSKASVSSLRRNPAQELVAVQIAGEVQPGNSGGPVTNSKGQVVGVAQSKVTGTGTVFAVPPEEIQIFLRPRPRSCSIRALSADAAKARQEVTAVIADAQGVVNSVWFHWCPRGAAPAEFKPDPSGRWAKLVPAMQAVALKLEDDTAVGEGDFPRPKDAGELEFVFQLSLILSNGQIWTEPALSTVTFDAAAPKPDPKPGPGPDKPPDPPVAKGVDIPVGDSLEIVHVLPLKSVVSDLVLTPDGADLFALNLSDGEVLRLDPENLAVKGRIETVNNAVTMCLTPDGKTIYVGARAPAPAGNPEGATGTIQSISVADFRVQSTFDVQVPIHRIVATNDGTVVASGLGQWVGLAFIDTRKKAVTGKYRSVYGGAILRLHPDGDRVYSGDTALGPPDFRCTLLKPEKSGQYPHYDSRYHGEHPLGGNFEISPDGRFLLGCGGAVLRIGKFGRESDLAFIQKIEPCLAFAVAKGSNTFLGATADGFLKVYDLAKLELVKSIKLEKFCPLVALDPRRQRLYAFSAIGVDAQGLNHRGNSFPAGDLVAISLTRK